MNDFIKLSMIMFTLVMWFFLSFLQVLVYFSPIIILFLIYYFAILKPTTELNNKKTLIQSYLKIGDKIITDSGVVGEIVSIDKKIIVLKTVDSKLIEVLISSVADKA